MKINRAYRYELKPNLKEQILLAKHAGCARFAYNWGLTQRIELYEIEKKSTNAIEQHRLLNGLKKTQFPWMYEVSKCAPQEALRDLDKAYKNFFRAQKEGKGVGFPKFKKKGSHDSFRLTGAIVVHEKTIQLPRLGQLRLKEIPCIQGHILSATVTREIDRWFVSISVEVELENPKPIEGKPVGVDMGLTSFATLSTGEKYDSPKPLKKQLKKLKRLSKQHTRKIRGSKNRKKSALKLGRKHRQIRNIRKDFHHKLSSNLAKTKPVIVVEDLNIRGMLRNHRLSRHIADAGWAEFQRMLEYKTKWYGSKLLFVPTFFPSSKLCTVCKTKIDKLSLSEREWKCVQCGTSHDRDITAAKNIVNYYTESSSGIYACGDTSDGVSQKLASHVSKKQEVISGIFIH